jgi:putative ABC transport system permease protein
LGQDPFTHLEKRLMRARKKSDPGDGEIKPPQFAQKFVAWYCKPALAEDLLGDLNEYFERNVEAIGVRRAKIIYVIDALKFFRTYTVRKPKYIDLFINWIMIGSYIKTSTRNVLKNKLFSSINIVGLAISMSVGLLMIAFLHDLLSYDKFHENGKRIYRITTHPTFNGELSNKFASTSVKMGKLIQDKVSGIEQATIMRNGFGGDGMVDDKVIPFGGFYAEPSFFNVFTFPLMEGNVATALKDPYSMVVTETTARKFFGQQDALGKTIKVDTLEFHITGIMKDVPFFSHMKFDALASFSTIETLMKDDKNFLKWTSMWSNYVYMLMPENANLESIRAQIDAISENENKTDANTKIQAYLLPLYKIMIGADLSNSIGNAMPVVVLWIIGGLAFIVILSACFNYTNLSIARSLRRFKEVGLRKVIGAGRSQVRQQFMAEAVIVSLAALAFSFMLFLVLRPQFIGMAPQLQEMVRLELTVPTILGFIALSLFVGILAGFLPALFFAKVNIINALKNASQVKVFKHLSLRRVLVVVQYTFTLVFITATAIGYKQYKSFLAFDLGFRTENIINIALQGNKPEALVKALEEMPEVTGISKSSMVTNIGSYWGGHMKYKNSQDSALVWFNSIDENYLALHDHKLLAGTNFISRPTTKAATSELIVNEKILKRFEIGDPSQAIGEEVTLDGKKLRIVGVVQEFHYGKVENQIEPVAFTFWVPEDKGHVNVKVQSDNIVTTMGKIESLWKSIDRVHPVIAKFYSEQIEDAYGDFSAMLKIIGFLAFLAISIASMGLFGMVVFTTETRLKEISIRKVMGATSGNLIFLLSRGFLFLLVISAIIAIPLTYFFFENVILQNFPFHDPIGFSELIMGLLGVLLIAFMMIGSQTLKAARSNPAEVLKSE